MIQNVNIYSTEDKICGTKFDEMSLNEKMIVNFKSKKPKSKDEGSVIKCDVTAKLLGKLTIQD